jgi:hypothetical protein
MQLIDTNQDPIEIIERLFHAAIASRSSGIEVERTLKGVLQSDFGVHEFFHSNQLSLNHTISDGVSAPRFSI